MPGLKIFSSMRCCKTEPSRLNRLAALFAACAAVAGCAVSGKPPAPQEEFSSTATYSRLFDAAPAQTCEAARRALLSRGYLIDNARADLVDGRKNFQPDAESHLKMEIRVVCVPDSGDGKVSLGFATAVQDRYALKKSNNSASLGVGVLGSVSLPFASSNDSLVKVGVTDRHIGSIP